MSVVVIAHTTQGSVLMVRQAHHNGLSKGLKPALDAVFTPHGGIEAVIPPKKDGGGTVYVKPNAVHFVPPHSHRPRRPRGTLFLPQPAQTENPLDGDGDVGGEESANE